MTQQTKTPELITDLEREWLNLLRKALPASVSGRLTFENVNVADNRVWAERVIETIHCQVPTSVAVRR